MDGSFPLRILVFRAGTRNEFTAVFLSTLFYCCWEHRNQRRHSGEGGFEQLVEEFSETYELGKSSVDVLDLDETWKMPMRLAFKEGKQLLLSRLGMKEEESQGWLQN